jgi:predicted Rossmann fold nucleotide-binding protein DprA/Smf involved in DNA uptake
VPAIGNESLMETQKLALLCSRACPGSIIIQTLDAVRALRQSPWTVISGFQSPVEQEALAMLLVAQRPVVICPARTVCDMRVPPAWKDALAAGRMLISSPFERTARRATAAFAEQRNRYVLSLADAVFIPHAAPGGNLERLCRDSLPPGKPLWTFPDPANSNLLGLGAQSVPEARVPDPNTRT